MGTAFLYFKPDGMSFEDYFKVDGHATDEQYARFIAGLSPAMVQRDYLVAPEAVNFAEKRGPSTVMACDLCAGVMGTNVLKVLLGRGKLRAAPWGMHFDAYHQVLKHTWAAVRQQQSIAATAADAHPAQAPRKALADPVSGLTWSRPSATRELVATLVQVLKNPS